MEGYYRQVLRPIEKRLDQQRGADQFARRSRTAPTDDIYRRLDELQQQNRQAFERLARFRAASDTATSTDTPAPEQFATAWDEQQQALDAAQAATEAAAGEAQALIADVESLPPGAEKDELGAELTRSEDVASDIEAVIPLLQAQLDNQREAATRDARLAELTANLVTSSEALLEATRQGHTEAIRRDKAAAELSRRLLWIAALTLLFAAIGILRDFGAFGTQPVNVTVVAPTASPSLIVSPSPGPTGRSQNWNGTSGPGPNVPASATG